MKYRYLAIVAFIALILLGGYFIFSSRTSPTSCDKGSTFKDGAGREYVSCMIIVKFQSEITLDQAEMFIKSQGLEVSSSSFYDKSKFLTVKTPLGKEKLFISKLKESPQVKSVEQSVVLSPL